MTCKAIEPGDHNGGTFSAPTVPLAARVASASLKAAPPLSSPPNGCHVEGSAAGTTGPRRVECVKADTDCDKRFDCANKSPRAIAPRGTVGRIAASASSSTDGTGSARGVACAIALAGGLVRPVAAGKGGAKSTAAERGGDSVTALVLVRSTAAVVAATKVEAVEGGDATGKLVPTAAASGILAALARVGTLPLTRATGLISARASAKRVRFCVVEAGRADCDRFDRIERGVVFALTAGRPLGKREEVIVMLVFPWCGVGEPGAE